MNGLFFLLTGLMAGFILPLRDISTSVAPAIRDIVQANMPLHAR